MSIQPRYEIFVERLPGENVIIHQVNIVGPDPTDPTKEVRESVICQMLNVGDARVQAKLVELGWTPPGTESLLKVAVQELLTVRQRAGGGLPPKLHDAIAALAPFIK